MDPRNPREHLRRWLLALGCFATLVWFFSPPWAAFLLWARVPELGVMLEVRRGVSVLAQAAHPGAPIADPLHAAIQWRLLFPVLGYVFHLPPVVLFGLAHVGALAVLGYLVALLRRARLDWPDTALATLSLGAASWFFTSTGWLGYYDSWLALALLVLAFDRTPWAVWIACALAPWIDERFVLAAPLALGCRWLQAGRAARPLAAARGTEDGANLRARTAQFVVPAALLVAFVALRLGVLARWSGANATLAGYLGARDYLDAPFSRVALGIWEGLRGGWVFVAAAVFLLANRVHAAVLASATLVLAAIGLATAQDYSRTMTMLLPVAVLGALTLADRTWPRRRALLAFTAAAALVLPAHHVMNDATNPIYYLYHELAALKTPPAIAMAELHELSAIHAMEQGDFAKAEAKLTLAIKLARNPASAAHQRGMLYASAQRWEDARRDFTLVTQAEPQNPDGWFLKAQAEFALRNAATARDDFDHARSLAPEGWTERPDVKRFGAALRAPPIAR